MNDSPDRTPQGRGRARANSGSGNGSDGGQWGNSGGWDGSGGGVNGRGDGSSNGSGGWGGQQWSTPPPSAPQPGVVPLRPLGVGEILDGAVSTTRLYWRTVLGVSAAVALGTQAAGTTVTGLWFRDVAGLNKLADPSTADLHEVLDAVGKSLGSLTVASLVGLVGTIIASAMLTVVVSRAVLGRPASVGDAWRDARPRLLALTGLFLLVPLLMAAAFAVGLAPGLVVAAGSDAGISGDPSGGGAGLLGLGGLAGMAAAAWLWVRYSLAAPALMLEKQGVISAMRRSAKLVRGASWRIFGIQVLAAFIVFMIGSMAQIPTSLIDGIVTGESTMDHLTWTSLIINGVGAATGSALALPITAGVTALLYMDQRIRRESLDIELARAAGM
ncbi:glycerophosphoryl diester phosphodiesterase membrane domain-containing protein [Streptomyces abikoensis]|uniref:glycerophosphoryl diester phosphodiesterase membrane domain-containing protein n=1 Tax=Streptomyces abikoensis TaxID=97398 RepID=UPI0036D05441